MAGDLADALRPNAPKARRKPTVIGWADCQRCSETSALTHVAADGAVTAYTQAVCLGCGAVLCADVDEDGVEWVVMDGEWPRFVDRVVSAVALAAARRIAGWGRAAWWEVADGR